MVIKNRKTYIKHMFLHYRDNRCPICNMYTENLSSHLALHHLNPTRRLLLEKDLAILCKEAGTTKILKDKNLNLRIEEIVQIKEFIKKL